MTSSPTSGMQIRRGAQWWRHTVELVSSMRFAVALLTVICIASVIGTVVTQQQPYNNYINQFGPFWAQVFDALKVYSIYSAWWFLLILAFLVISTSLCVARHVPKIARDYNNLKENIGIRALQAFGHKADLALMQTAPDAAQRIGQTLVGNGWKVKLQERPGKGWMVAAKAGSMNKIGYLAAHSAIVLICLGGLLDGDLTVRAQTWFNGKVPYAGGGMVADVPPMHRLSVNTPSYRGNVFVPENGSADTALLMQKDGVLLQELPFVIELKKFIVEYYPTGMPRLFASDIIIHDKETGEAIPQRVEVNHPASYKGIQIYQSSFDDGGSKLKLEAVPMQPGVQLFAFDGVVGGGKQIQMGDKQMTVEFTSLRAINVENMVEATGAEPAKVDLTQSLQNHMGSAANRKSDELKNVGPSFNYKLRDASGQAIEFNNYRMPLPTGKGVPEFMFGVRTDLNDNFRYLRIPADDQGTIDEFIRLRTALYDPAMRAEAVRRYVATASKDNPALAQQLQVSAERVMTLFAGDVSKLPQARLDPNGEAARSFGLQAVASFIEKNVPAQQQEGFGGVLLRILNGSLSELLQLERHKANLPPLDLNEERTRNFMSQAVVALSDAPLYPEPFVLQLKSFDQVQASVFQVARAPGKWIVYLGCFFLCVGIFAMLYIRERRVWVWVTEGEQGTQATMAYSSNRRNIDSDKEFHLLQQKIQDVPK